MIILNEEVVRCGNCSLPVGWPRVYMGGVAYCCLGCAQGGPCYCSYDQEGKDSHVKMVLALVPGDVTGLLLSQLIEHSCQATLLDSHLESDGGELKAVLVGVGQEALGKVLEVVRSTNRFRDSLDGGFGAALRTPANIFVWDVERFERL